MDKLAEAFQLGFQEEINSSAIEKESGLKSMLGEFGDAMKFWDDMIMPGSGKSLTPDLAPSAMKGQADSVRVPDDLQKVVNKDLERSTFGFDNVEDAIDTIHFNPNNSDIYTKRVNKAIDNYIEGDPRFPIDSLDEVSDKKEAVDSIDFILKYTDQLKDSMKGGGTLANSELRRIKRHKDDLRRLSGQIKIGTKLDEAFKAGFEDEEMSKEAVLPKKVRQITENIVDDVATAGKTTTNRAGKGSEGVVDIIEHPDLPVPVARKKWHRVLTQKGGSAHPVDDTDEMLDLMNLRKDIYNNSPVFPDVIKQKPGSGIGDKPTWYMEAVPGDVPDKQFGKALADINKRGPNIQTVRNIQSPVGPGRLKFPVAKDMRTGSWLHDIRPDNMGVTQNSNYSILDAIPTEDLGAVKSLDYSREMRKPRLGSYADDTNFANMSDLSGMTNWRSMRPSPLGRGSDKGLGATDTAIKEVKDVLSTDSLSDVSPDEMSKAVDEVVANI